MALLDPRACYRILQSRDRRFDGRLFVAVTSTGIYCRPICPARTPRPEHCRFYPSAAAAQAAGFRPCLRCRPDIAPDLPMAQGTASTVSRALALIADGLLDGDDERVDLLAARVGIGERHLRRLFQQHLGASPIAVAQTRRVLFAKRLIHDTEMRMADVAGAAGFRSIRRFNETFRALFGRAPRALRRRRDGGRGATASAPVVLRLSYRPPYDWDRMLAFFRARAIDGVEFADGVCYRRTVMHGRDCGWIDVRHDPRRNGLLVAVRFPNVRALPSLLARIARLFDVNADIETIGRHLSRDPLLAPLVASRPGLRTPGAWDGFELAMRAVLGQQVTIQAARLLASRLVGLCGSPLGDDPDRVGALTHVFPTPAHVAAADLSSLPMPGARREALRAVAEAALAMPDLFAPRGGIDETVARLRAIRGIGDWTAHYIALRALREPDAFPASDIGLLRGATRGSDRRPSPAMLLRRAEPWRPWRAYAAQHLWAADAAASLAAREARVHA